MAVSAQYSVTIRVELDARQEPLGRLTAATVYCAHAQEDLLAAEGVPRDRLVHIPNGIPVASIRASSWLQRRCDCGPARGPNCWGAC